MTTVRKKYILIPYELIFNYTVHIIIYRPKGLGI